MVGGGSVTHPAANSGRRLVHLGIFLGGEQLSNGVRNW